MAGSSGYKLDQPTVDAIIELISTYISTGQLPGGGGSTPLEGNLTSTSTTSALRADQGPAITTLISTAQSTANNAGTAAANAQASANAAQSTANGKYTKPGSGIPRGDLEKYPTIAIVGSKLLSDSDSGSVFTVAGSVAVTIPTGLVNTFTATFLLQNGGSVNVIPTSPVTLNGGTTTLSRSTTTDTRVDLVSLVSVNTYVLTGGLALGSGGTNATNLTTSTSATTLTVNSDTGTDAVLPAATTSVAGVLTAADKTKLDGIAVNATANTSDAVLLNRANHTGTQSVSTITGLGTAATQNSTAFATAAQGSTADAAALKLTRLPVSVLDYGADSTGASLSNTAFTNALANSKMPYVPPGTYYLDNFNVGSFGVKFWGPGNIKTSSGRVINLATVNLEQQESNKIMFVEGNKPSYEELLDIKSLGYTTVMAYPWTIDLDTLIKNAEAVGLKLLVHGGMGISVPATVVPNVTYDSRDSVIGYYVLDEPALNGISVVDQNRAITAYKAVTSKPLYCAENAVMYTNPLISSQWDVILADVYYANAHSSANDALKQVIRNIAEFKLHAPNASVVPCMGLFNDTGFTKSASLTRQLAEVIARFATTQDFAVFCWDAGTTPNTYQGVRNNATYYATAQRLTKQIGAHKPYKIELVLLGDNLNNTLHRVYKNTVDSGTLGLPGAPTVFPWEVQNVGAITDARRSNFAASGLMVTGTGGTCGFTDMPAGICASVLYFNNYGTGATCTVELGYSTLGGYDFVSVASVLNIASGAGSPIAAQLNSNLHVLPMLRATLSSSTPAPYAFLKGYMAFSDVPSVSF